ncbi:MAG: hypothetical protein ACJA0U_000256 [Salibacteraceae bacterium]|jgi:hypothetical protein
MAGTAYKLKKYLKFVAKPAKSNVEEVKASLMLFFDLFSAPKMLCMIIKI